MELTTYLGSSHISNLMPSTCEAVSNITEERTLSEKRFRSSTVYFHTGPRAGIRLPTTATHEFPDYITQSAVVTLDSTALPRRP